MTTPTPRTDAAAVNAHDGLPVKRVSADFARQLERDLAAAQERAEKAEAERDSLLRGEYICRSCGLRKNGESDATPTF